jgi:hypothetical protein
MGRLETGTHVTERHSEGKTTPNAAQHASPEVAIPAPQAPVRGARRPGNGWPPWGVVIRPPGEFVELGAGRRPHVFAQVAALYLRAEGAGFRSSSEAVTSSFLAPTML